MEGFMTTKDNNQRLDDEAVFPDKELTQVIGTMAASLR
jgi:hypothetical protein